MEVERQGTEALWIYHGHLNSLPRSLRLYVLSLPLVSQFPPGPSHCQGSRLLRPGGRLSRLLRPGGRLSRLLRPGGRLSRLLRPGGRLSRLLCPGGRLSRLLRPGGRLSHLLRPGGRLSRLLRPGGRLSRLLRPGGRLTCQSHLTSLLSLPPHPGGLLSHWPHMNLALRSLPRFHLRSTALLDCVCVCEASGSRSLWGALSRIWLPLTTLQLHITHGLQLPSFTALRHTHIHHCTNYTAVTNH